MAGCFLGAITLFPFYKSFTHFGNPDLEIAMERFPAVVIADPRECSLQLVPSELKKHIKFTSSCDVLKSLLNQYSVSYTNQDAPTGSLAKLRIGNMTVSSVDISGLTVGFITGSKKGARIFSKIFQSMKIWIETLGTGTIGAAPSIEEPCFGPCSRIMLRTFFDTILCF